MPISMQQSAHYVTQSSIYDCPKLGRLTDRRIAFYQKRGHYDPQAILERKETRSKKRTKPTKKDNLLQKLLLNGLI